MSIAGNSSVLVINPLNGDSVDLFPLFELMHEGRFEVGGGVVNLVRTVQVIHDFTSSQIELDKDSTIESQFGELKSVNYSLVQLRKAFEAMGDVRQRT